MLAIFGTQASAQNLPGSLSFTVSGSFENGVGEGNNSILIADNNLTDGYAPGMDLTGCSRHSQSQWPCRFGGIPMGQRLHPEQLPAHQRLVV